MTTTSNWVFANPLAKTTFTGNIVGAAIATPSTPTTTTSTTGGTIPDATTRCYTIVSRNTNGFTPQSTEKCQTTGSSGSNTNSITVQWLRAQGATQYQVCEGTTGAELLAFTAIATDLIAWTDSGVTSSGACSTTNTTLPGLDPFAYINLQNQASGFASKLVPTTLTANRTATLPDSSGIVAYVLTGTTGTITGTVLTATCDSGTASVTNSIAGQPVIVSSTTGADVGGAFYLRGSVTSNGTVTVYVCGTGTPASLAYNVRVIQ
jgi:hypothetical protein